MNRKYNRFLIFIIVFAMLISTGSAMIGNVIAESSQEEAQELHPEPESESELESQPEPGPNEGVDPTEDTVPAGDSEQPVDPEQVEDSEPAEEADPVEEPEDAEVEEVVDPMEPEEVQIEEDSQVGEQEPMVEPEEEEEEYGPGAMLDGFPATPHPGGGSITWFAPGSLGAASISQSKFRMMSDPSGLEPGGVRTSKTASPVPSMVNTWDIKVRIEGRDDQRIETTDVVLVIDRSGSMDDNDRMTNAKTAANNFIDTMIPQDPSLRIAIVSFASSYQGAQLVTVNSNFTRNITQLKNAVNGLAALGGTHTQAGIVQGHSLLTGSNADNKYMVLLSDGQPTYSYEPQNWANGRPSWGTTGGISNGNQRTAVYDGNYNTGTIVGTGSDLRQSYNYTTGPWWNQTTHRRHIDNGAAAIRAGQDARPGLDGLFTIAVEAGSEGTSILASIASPGMAYSTNNPGDLQEIYDIIGTQIQTQYALRNVVLTDEMGDGFSLINGTLTTSEGSTTVAPSGGGSNETITWTINPGVTGLVPGTDDVRYAEMTYRVEINDEILDISGAKSNDTKLFETNKLTQLNYKDVNGNNASEDIASPMVDPVLLRIKKILINPNDPETRRFNVEISKEEPNSFNQTIELVPNAEDYVWLTSLRHEGSYNVEETSITGDGITNIEGFDIFYNIDGQDTDSFQVYHDIEGTPRSDIDIKVTNKLFGEATPDEPLIRVSKTFSGLSQQQIDQLSNFKITITSQSDPTRTRDLLLNQGTRHIETNGDITYKWEIEGWPAGTYIIDESGEELENYEVIIENDGSVTTVKAAVTWDTNPWKKPNTQVNNDLKQNGIPPNLVATKLTTSEGVFVWTETRLSASQRLAVIDALSGFNELGLTENNGYWYSGQDIAGEDFYFRGYKIQYDLSTGNLHIPQANQWALIISGAYEFEGGDPADIAVKNSYTLNAVDVTIEKEVTGNLGDMQGEFEFTVIIDGDEDNPEIFNLSHGGSKILEDISADAVLTLIEDARGHDVTVLVGGNVITANSDGSYTINLADYQGDITIEVNNDKNETIDTGIMMDSMPYILILIGATMGLGVKIVRKKKYQ